MYFAVFFEELLEFSYFGIDYALAIRLVRVQLEIVLMVCFGWVKLWNRANLGYDPFIDLFFQQLFFHFFGRNALRFILIKHDRTILCANVIPLFVEAGRIMGFEEYQQQLIEGHDGWIESDLANFGMPCTSGANCLVGWI